MAGITLYCQLQRPFEPVSCQAETPSADDVPRQRFRKDLAHPGIFYNGGDRYEITEPLLHHWAASAEAWLASGRDIPIPDLHATDGDPKRNNGYVRAVWVERGRLMGELELIGRDAIEAAQKSRVSVYSEPVHHDSQGGTWRWPLLHVALTTAPVIPGQGPFVPIAASISAPSFPLSQETHTMDAHQPPPPNEPTGPDTPENRLSPEEWVKTLGLPPETLASDGAHAVSVMGKKLMTLQRREDELAQQLQEARERVKWLSPSQGPSQAAEPVSMSRDALSLAQSLIAEKLEGLVRNGRITPAVRDRLQPLLSQGGPYLLSVQTQEPGQRSCRALRLLEALELNEPVGLEERTGAQSLAMSRQHPNQPPAQADPQQDPSHDPAVTERMVRFANRRTGKGG